MELGRRIAQALEGATFDRVAGISLANAEANRPRIGQSILALGDQPLGEGDAAIVVGAGPSLRRRQSLERIRDAKFRGTVVSTDGALGACLRAGVVPHLVVTVDPHADRIVRWFGDPALAAPAMRVAVATSAAPAVVERCEQAGMAAYWWNPMLDDPDAPGSISRQLHRENKLPSLNGGGNVGTAAWVIAHAVLGRKHVALIGMDFGYPPGTPYGKTQYYPELVELLGERWQEAYTHVKNPYSGEEWFCDPAYLWFRDVILEMAGEADCETVNCTEGGILFGERIPMVSLDRFLAAAA
jgi:hypothetical protein